MSKTDKEMIKRLKRLKRPAADDIRLGDPAILFDGRYVQVVAAPEIAEPIGRWAKVCEVTNATGPNFSYPKLGPVEKMSLAGAVHALSDAARPKRETEVPS